MWVIANGDITLGVIACENRYWSCFVKIHGGIADVNQSVAQFRKGIAKIYSIYGVRGGKQTKSSMTIISSGKNIGRSNETTPLEQAMSKVESMYSKKIKAGYRYVDRKGETSVVAQDKIFRYPMALHSWVKYKDRISYPVLVQPKLDGVRCVARWDTLTMSVDLYTRRGKLIDGFMEIRNELHDILEDNQGIHIDGELYNHSMLLQDISGIVRNTSDARKSELQLMVFDCFDITNKEWICEDRHQWLSTVCVNMDHVKLVDTQYIETEEESDILMRTWGDQGYEGIVYKNPNAVYEWGEHREKRSSQYIKRKKVEDNEFEIIGFTKGVGKFADMIVFELKTPNGNKFNCVPMGTAEYRRQLLIQAKKDFSVFKNKFAKVKYDALSASGIPVRARIVQIVRDTSFD